MYHENALPQGHRIEEYEILAVLGAGNFGITYLALDTGLDIEVAIKEYLPQEQAVRRNRITVVPKSASDRKLYQWGLERFIAETRLLAGFNHPNIVRVRRYFEANGTAYMVMDYEPGQTLEQWLENQRGRPDEEMLKTLFLPILDGLRAVHEANFLHRDIKPDNIYLRENGNPMLIDFGAARMALGQKSCSLTSIATPGYAAYEQYSTKGAAKQGEWSDIYGLGASLYRCISGKAPVDANDRATAHIDEEPDPMIPATERGSGKYSEAFLQAIDHALAFRPKDRPQTVREFQEELMGKAPTPPPPDPLPGRKMLVGVLLAVLALAVWRPWSGSGQVEEKLAQNPAARQWEEDIRRAELERQRQEAERKRIEEEQRLAESLRQEEERLQIILAREKEKHRWHGPFEPEMVVIPGGSFVMGSPPDEPERNKNEDPRHRVHVPSFELGKYEVTFAQWDACVADRGCRHRPDDKGWGRGNRPVIDVSWDDIQEYLKWLNGKTGKRYRLPSEAEWEYAARAGTGTPFSTGECINTDQANYDGNYDYNDCGAKTGVYLGKTQPVGSYPPNGYGLYDMHGNVREWLADCWNDNYAGAPADGSAWLTGDCARRVVRGGSWIIFPRLLRSASRENFSGKGRYYIGGFRVARTLTP